MTNSILALVVKVIAAFAPLNPECLWGLESSQRLIEPGRDARSDSVQLMDQNRCRWNLVSQEAGAAVLWRFDSLERPVEIEIAAALDGERGTATGLDSTADIRSSPSGSFMLQVKQHRPLRP